jgi:nucleotide-binding universal stress UspA family protein
MRSILVFADRGAAMAERLETGLSLARAGGGHVTLLVDTPVARYISMDPMGGSYLASDALKQALADDDAHAAAIEARLAGQDVPFDIVRSEAEPVDALAAHARLADVVIVSRSSGLAGELALASRTPILVVGEGTELAAPPACACVAWDGGDEAAHALRAAAPLLALGGRVHVLTVQEKPGGFPATDALRYLSRHGVKAELHELPRTGSTEETIAAACARLQAGLLVMGAFGHSRMREYLFGGVTRYFLEEVQSPALLLAH